MLSFNFLFLFRVCLRVRARTLGCMCMCGSWFLFVVRMCLCVEVQHSEIRERTFNSDFKAHQISKNTTHDHRTQKYMRAYLQNA